jgi:hypothetical protein
MKVRSLILTIFVVSLSVLSTGCSTLADAKSGKGTGVSQTFNAKPDRVWQVLPSAVKNTGLEYVAGNKDEGYALAQRGITAFSYGENVAIFVDSAPADSTKVEVVSKKAMATNIFAPEWSKSIFEKLAELLK